MARAVSKWLLAWAFIAAPLQATPAQSSTATTDEQRGRAPLFVPVDFQVPTHARSAQFKIVPLGPDVVEVDYEAYMSSIEHLQKSFTRSTEWPHKNISRADAMRDMENEQQRFASRTSFAFAVLTPDGRRERGSVYISPSPVIGYDAVVKMWVTKRDFDAGFDAELYAWVVDWVRTKWPFRRVAYPGRSIGWQDWDRFLANSTFKKPMPEAMAR